MDARRFVEETLDWCAEALQGVEVDYDFQLAVEALVRPGVGKVVTTGMGKAGHVAAKFASTLCSVGVPALFLHPGEAGHGDLGVVGDGDRVFAFSNSGETREVIETVRRVENLGAKYIVAITGNGDGEVARWADCVLDYGPVQEAGSLGLVPTVSSAVMMAIGDGLAIAAAEVRGTSRDEFGRRHHDGYLGKTIREGAR